RCCGCRCAPARRPRRWARARPPRRRRRPRTGSGSARSAAAASARRRRRCRGTRWRPAPTDKRSCPWGFSVRNNAFRRASRGARVPAVKVACMSDPSMNVPSMNERIRHPGLAGKLATAAGAAAHIRPGDTVAMSGFTGAGYPKAVPQALAERMERAHAAGDAFRVKVLTGASTAPELDGALAKVDGMELRMPYQSDPEVRSRINAGRLEYIDIHLSHVAQHTWFGFFGDIDVALVEVSAI